MSSTTIGQDTSELSNPDAYLDAKSSALLSSNNIEGIAGWVFDISNGETVDLSSDITDHYVESGSFVTDHVVKKPIVITLSGFKGELVYQFPKKTRLGNIANALQTGMGFVDAYAGKYTAQVTDKINQAVTQVQYAAKMAKQLKDRATNLKKLFDGEDNSPNLQTKAFVSLQAMWQSSAIMTVQTPWGYYQNMIIQSISAKQDDKSNDYTDFTVTLKEMRFATTKTTTFDANSYASDIQAATPTDTGQSSGGEVNKDSLLYQGAGNALKGMLGVK